MITWRKSTRSNGQGECVEVASQSEMFVRDTKLGEASPILTFPPESWRRFVTHVKAK